MDDKRAMRTRMRTLRRSHEAGLADATRALLFLRPPARIAELVPEGSVVGIYHAVPPEAPTSAYIRWFHEHGRRIALPWFADRTATMEFHEWRDPWDDDLLEPGPFGALQPLADAAPPEPGLPGPAPIEPALAIVPLIAFTAQGHRLGQGGGHYDRWRATHPLIPAIGLAWDCQLVDQLPIEPHDFRLDAVVTPTRFYEG